MKKNRKKLLLAGVACALGLSLGVSTHAVYENELIESARDGKLAAVQDYVAKVNVKGQYGWTALMIVAFDGHLDVVKCLVEHGADVNAQGSYALREAVKSGNLDIVQYLVKHGADVNATDINGKTALTYATEENHLEIAEYLNECSRAKRRKVE